MSTDEVLVRAWNLALEDLTDDVQDELETLIPTLVEAGYAESDDWTWGFTQKGIERIDALGEGN